MVEYGKVTQNIDGQTFDLTTARRTYEHISLPLLGKHQRDNVGTSICVMECLQDLGFKIPVNAQKEGCKNIFWPGRLEVVGREPLVLLDSAHNDASARVLSETIKELLGGKKVVLVLGVSSDKDKKAICDELTGIACKIILTKANHPRAHDFDGAVNVKTALDLARRETGREDVILIAGSVFVVSEARRELMRDRLQLI